jgi:ATP synthase protein I
MTERQSPPSPDDSAQQGPTLEDLDARLRKARGDETFSTDPNGKGAGFQSGMGGAGAMLRIGIEMVSSVAVGVGIGWLLDSWLGTKPWLMVLFFFMGAAAGILGAYRATGRIAYGPDAVTDAAKDKHDADTSARNDRE